MKFIPAPPSIMFRSARETTDWDGLFTLLLTCLLIPAGLGIPLLIYFVHAFRVCFKHHPHSQPSNAVLVFGKQLHKDAIDSEYKSRLDRTIKLFKSYNHPLIILLGGSTRAGQITEAEAGLAYLQTDIEFKQHGAAVLEKDSQNTLENLRHARELLHQQGLDQVTLVTNAYHLARVQQVADNLGIRHQLHPAEDEQTLNLSLILKLLGESFFMLWFATGRFWANATRNRRMIERIT